MAKTSEKGIEYFPLNADIVHNSKIKLVVAEFGPRTWAVLLPLYCKIYREKGYWIDWFDEDSKLLFAQDECKLEIGFMNEVVSGCIRRSLFDRRVFDTFGVLTSDRIQMNYLEATKRRVSVQIISEFFCIENDDVNILSKNVNIIDLNVNILTKKVNIQKQSRRRVEGEVKENAPTGDTHTPDQIELFNQFSDWLGKHFPRVTKMKKPISIDEYLKLKETLTRETLTKLLTAMENRADLHKKYVSAYLTINNWSKNEFNQAEPKQEQGSVLTALKNVKSKEDAA